MKAKQRERVLPVGVLENLQQVVDGDQEGFELRTGYSLFLDHGLMGYFPAIYKHDEEEIICFDKELIEKVWALLSPRKSKIRSELFYVNRQTGYCYAIPPDKYYGPEKMEAIEFLTQEKFEKLIAENPEPFEWAPGLVSDDMTNEEFQRTIQAAISQLPPEDLVNQSVS